MITAVVNPENVHHITHSLRREHYGVTILEGNGIEKEKMILMSLVPRKKRKEVTEIITKFEPNAFISAEKVATIQDSKTKEMNQ